VAHHVVASSTLLATFLLHKKSRASFAATPFPQQAGLLGALYFTKLGCFFFLFFAKKNKTLSRGAEHFVSKRGIGIRDLWCLFL